LLLFKNSSDKVGIVGCNILIINEKKSFKKYKTPSYPDNVIFKKNLGSLFIFLPLIPSSLIIKKTILNNIKKPFFNEFLNCGEDADFLLKILKNYSFRAVPKVLVKYHVHKKNLSLAVNLKEEIKTWKYFITKYRNEYQKYPFIYSTILRRFALRYFAIKQPKLGRKYCLHSIKINPLNLKSYFHLTYSFFSKEKHREYVCRKLGFKKPYYLKQRESSLT